MSTPFDSIAEVAANDNSDFRQRIAELRMSGTSAILETLILVWPEETKAALPGVLDADDEGIDGEILEELQMHIGPAREKVEGPFGALAVIGRLHLLSADKTALAAYAEQSRDALTKSGAIGKVNWCNVVVQLNATIEALTAAGLAVPPFLTVIVTIISSFCPTP